MRRILEGFKSDKVDEPCTDPKQKQSQELPRKRRNKMRREQICFTCHATWTLGHICGENMGKELLHLGGVRDTKANTTKSNEDIGDL